MFLNVLLYDFYDVLCKYRGLLLLFDAFPLFFQLFSGKLDIPTAISQSKSPSCNFLMISRKLHKFFTLQFQNHVIFFYLCLSVSLPLSPQDQRYLLLSFTKNLCFQLHFPHPYRGMITFISKYICEN